MAKNPQYEILKIENSGVLFQKKMVKKSKKIQESC